MNVTITIDRDSVLGIVEGLTATISQHNAGVPTYDQLWARDAESPKLDIWWREGLTDLEAGLKKWFTSTQSQFVLQAAGTDVTLTINVGSWWDEKLSGLLANKMQQYMVHAVMAGWLSDFDGVKAPDYKALAVADIVGIANVILYKDLAFAEEARTADVPKGDSDADAISADARTADVSKEDIGGDAISEEARTADRSKDEMGADAISEDARTADTPKADGETDAVDEQERTADVPKADLAGDAIEEEARTADTPKGDGSGDGIAEDKRTVDVAKEVTDGDVVDTTNRNRDNYTGDGGGMQLEETERDKDDCFHKPIHSAPWAGEGVGIPGKKHCCHHPFWRDPHWRY